MTDAERKPWGASGWYWYWGESSGGPFATPAEALAASTGNIPDMAGPRAVYIDADGEIERLREEDRQLRDKVVELHCRLSLITQSHDNFDAILTAEVEGRKQSYERLVRRQRELENECIQSYRKLRELRDVIERLREEVKQWRTEAHEQQDALIKCERRCEHYNDVAKAKALELEALKDENAKLRELVRDAYGDGLNTAWHDRARELLEGGDK